MNKEQIQHKFDQILAQGNFPEVFVELEMDVEVLRLFAQVFNLGLEVAANNAEADYNIIDSFDRITGENIEVYVLKNSILKHKL
jgi:hypothetical protein